MFKVGDSIISQNAQWTFKGEASNNFDAHVSKSVPFYDEGHNLVALLSDFFLHDDSICYELGCSTGQLLSILARHNEGKLTRFVGIDPEPNMVRQAREKCSSYANVEIFEGDAVDFMFEKADLIVAYYTIQFIRPKLRQLLFDRIYESLNWGGALLIFEKVRAPDARFQDIATAVYTDYKLSKGYNAEEILGKMRSLKGVLEPFSTQGNLDLLKRAGFVDMMSIMKYVCFEGILAIK
jgi:tRNA (cmo5U34)-methyltransferase